MCTSSFECEKSIKGWAKVINIIAGVFMGLCGLGAVILLCGDAEDFWWLALILLAVGGLSMLSAAIVSRLLWGFGDIVGNVQRISVKSSFGDAQNSTEGIDSEELPEL